MVTLSWARGDAGIARTVTLSCARGEAGTARTVTLAMRTDANRR